MGIFSSSKPFFSVEEQASLVQAIRFMEQNTSGEIRLYVESKNPFVDPLERAGQIFFSLKMENTEDRNAVLIYLATSHREFAIFADEGIYQKLGQEYWNGIVSKITQEFSADNIVEGLVHCIQKIGFALQQQFPYLNDTDKNELPDDIVFGR